MYFPPSFCNQLLQNLDRNPAWVRHSAWASALHSAHQPKPSVSHCPCPHAPSELGLQRYACAPDGQGDGWWGGQLLLLSAHHPFLWGTKLSPPCSPGKGCKSQAPVPYYLRRVHVTWARLSQSDTPSQECELGTDTTGPGSSWSWLSLPGEPWLGTGVPSWDLELCPVLCASWGLAGQLCAFWESLSPERRIFCS